MKTNSKRWKYLLCITAVMTVFASIPFSTEAADMPGLMDHADKKQEITLDKKLNVTAGAADVLDSEVVNTDMQTVRESKIAALEADTAASISAKSNAMTAFAKGLMVLQPQIKPESTLVMAKVNEYANIRVDADQDSEKVGVLYKDCGGNILEKNDEWTKIESGDVTGWIKNEYLYFGKEAEELAKEVGVLTAYSNTKTLIVREDPNLEAGIIGFLSEGQAVEAVEEEGDWVQVSYEGATGFVAAEYVRVEFGIDTAESMAVIKAREEAERERAAAVAAATKEERKEAVLATASELEILAALIQCEAGGEPYEGQVAVGAVVMNRVRNAGYPNNITDVIYASGQFVPASGGRMEALILNKTTRESCVQAAKEAISGVCNIGDALHFRRNNGRPGQVIGNHVFW